MNYMNDCQVLLCIFYPSLSHVKRQKFNLERFPFAIMPLREERFIMLIICKPYTSSKYIAYKNLNNFSYKKLFLFNV